jgi:hypothetical protein
VYSGCPSYVACSEPPDLVIVPSLPVTPEPAVAGPTTGGQKVAHEPVHFDVVEVSGTNQYKVNPAEFVTTDVPLIVFAASAAPAELDPPELDPAGVAAAGLDAAGLDAAAAAAEPVPLVAAAPPELPHAATTSATAASPVAPNILRIR